MRKVTNYIITKESFEDMCKAQRFNPCVEITFRDKSGPHTRKLSAGHSDDLHVFRENGHTFILTNNTFLGYVGLEVFNGGERIGELFLEYHQVIEFFGRCGLAPHTIIKRLKDYVYS